jgi:ABC-type bacteriocin/lantibiotic exporter with double-glycine peptidase domain
VEDPAYGAPVVVTRPARQVLAILDRATRAGLVASAVLAFAERCVLVFVAIAFVHAEAIRGILVTVALAVLYGTQGALRATLGRLVYARLAAATVRALVEKDSLAGITREPAEDEQQAVFEGLSRGEVLATYLIPDLIGNGAASAVLIFFVARAAPLRLVVLGMLAAISAGVAAALVRKLVTNAEERSRTAFVPVVDAIVGALRGRIELVASGRGQLFAARSDVALAEWRRMSSRADRLAGFAGRAPVAAATFVVGLIVIFDRTSGGSMSNGALADAAVFASVVPSFAGAARAVVEIARSRARLQPLAELLGAAPADSPRTQRLALPRLPAPVELHDVSFAYPGAPGRNVLRNLSLHWSAKSALVIAGPNGSGKSTLLRLILGLGTPTVGTLALGGVPLRDLDLVTWRRSIAYLAQRPYLPDRATVSEAVRALALEVSDEAVVSALKRVGVHEALREILPAEPLAVPIRVLSIGQRQRVALARVLCQNAPIVLLDEPDANLDAAGIRLVAELVREMAREKMIAVVAHSTELLADAELVVRLDADAHLGPAAPGDAA